MNVLIGLFIIVLIALALWNRRRERRAWVEEERYDESGAWLDKRAGERGTRGSLDVEREQERTALARQGRVHELANQLRAYMFEHYPGFHMRGDAEIKNFTSRARTQANQWIAALELALQGQSPGAVETAPAADEHARARQKILLNFAYQHFPALLELDVAVLQRLDALALKLAEGL